MSNVSMLASWFTEFGIHHIFIGLALVGLIIFYWQYRKRQL